MNQSDLDLRLDNLYETARKQGFDLQLMGDAMVGLAILQLTYSVQENTFQLTRIADIFAEASVRLDPKDPPDEPHQPV